MAAETDRLRLSNRELFKIVRDNLPGTCVKTKNLLQIKDDILYVWDSANNGIYALNLKNCDADDVTPHQLLLPTDPPNFEVEYLLVNETATQLAVFGVGGVSVVDLPRRWGDLALFQGGKPSVGCRSRSLDERLFTSLQLLQARWHPGSAGAQHLLLLTSDNVLRLHDTVRADSRPRVWSLGRASAQRLPSLASLGDTAVDFDFLRALPQRPKLTALSPDSARDQADANAITWQVLVLYGNGDVWSVATPASTLSREKAQLVGPLPMYPADDDNYGVDSSSLLCLGSEPPVVVIASCSGLLYHCLLLDANHELGVEDSLLGGEDDVRDTALFVFESVELELGLSLRADDGSSVTCPIHLHHDISSSDRYFCSHDTGVHAISMPIIQKLESYIQEDEMEESELLSARSHAEYLLCTLTSGSALSPLLGLAQTGLPSHLVALLSDGEVVSLPVVSQTLRPRFAQTSPLIEDQVSPKEPGNRLMMPPRVSQPILKLSSGAGTQPQQCLELVNRATQQLRTSYFARHEAARDETQRRVRTLRALRDSHAADLAALRDACAPLQKNAARLAEKYEDAKDKQQRLTDRAERLLRLLSQREPLASEAERLLTAEIAQANLKVEGFQRAMAQARSRVEAQRAQAAKDAVNIDRRKVYLAPTKVNNTKAILLQCSEQIADMKHVVVMTKEDLGI